MYNNKKILNQYSLIDKKFRFLFDIYTNDPNKLPAKWRTSYIAGADAFCDIIL